MRGSSGLGASCTSGDIFGGDVPPLPKGDGADGSAGLQVYDAKGNALRTISPVTTSVDRRMLARKELLFSGVWLLPGPGRYRVVLTAPDGATLERTVQVDG
jgi:hypothetical protein